MTNSWSRKSSEAQKPKMNRFNGMAHSFNLHPCSSSMKIRICTPFLPKEIIFKILLCLPAEILYNIMRFVCREWYNIIKDPMFIDAYLQRSSKGVLMQIVNEGHYTQSAELGKDGVEITDINLPEGGVRNVRDFGWLKLPNSGWGIPLWPTCPISAHWTRIRAPYFPAGAICGSCNGLVLVVDLIWNRIHVANLIVKQKISLPPTNLQIVYYGKIGLAYAATSRKYKVVHLYSGKGRKYAFEIITVGIDKTWRHLCNVDELSCVRAEVDLGRFFGNRPAKNTAGFIHWVRYPYVLSLDVEKESFHFNVTPVSHWDKERHIFATESSLVFMLSCKELTWEQWALTEVETGTWLKLGTIDFSAKKEVFQSILLSCDIVLGPICLQQNGEIVCFQGVGRKNIIVLCRKQLFYNVKTGRISFFKFGGVCPGNVYFYPHVKSLISVGDDSRGPD